MRVVVEPKSHLQGRLLPLEGSWMPFSCAACFMAAATMAPSSDVTLMDVNVHPDYAGFLRYAILMGARITLLDQRWVGDQPVSNIHIQHAKQLRAITIRPEHLEVMGDTLPLLNVMAGSAQGQSSFPLQGSLALADCQALGLQAEVKDASLIISGLGRPGLQAPDTQGLTGMALQAVFLASLAAEGPRPWILEGCFDATFLSMAKQIKLRFKEASCA